MPSKEKSEKNLWLNYIVKNYRIWLILCYTMPVSMTKAAIIVWANLYLSKKGYFLPLTANQELPSLLWYSCLFLGILATCWLSDKLFFGNRWAVNIFFQSVLIALLLFLWLAPGDVVVSCYPYLMLVLLSFTVGLFVSIFIEAIALAHKKILAQSMGVLTKLCQF